MGSKNITLKNTQLSELLIEARESTDGERLRELAEHYNNGVVRLVASNVNTPLDVLEDFKNHENASVREWACLNPSSPVSVAVDLYNDSSPKVVAAAMKRLGLTV